jgi:hypothetical protein
MKLKRGEFGDSPDKIAYHNHFTGLDDSPRNLDDMRFSTRELHQHVNQ